MKKRKVDKSQPNVSSNSEATNQATPNSSLNLSVNNNNNNDDNNNNSYSQIYGRLAPTSTNPQMQAMGQEALEMAAIIEDMGRQIEEVRQDQQKTKAILQNRKALLEKVRNAIEELKVLPQELDKEVKRLLNKLDQEGQAIFAAKLNQFAQTDIVTRYNQLLEANNALVSDMEKKYKALERKNRQIEQSFEVLCQDFALGIQNFYTEVDNYITHVETPSDLQNEDNSDGKGESVYHSGGDLASDAANSGSDVSSDEADAPQTGSPGFK